MALFPLKFPSWRKRDAAGVGIGPGTATDTVDTLRRRARQRLIGTAILVVAGVVGFPLLFDSQPRPLPVELRVDLPDRDKVAPLVVAPATPAKPAPAAAPATAPAVAATPAQTPLIANSAPAGPVASAPAVAAQAPAATSGAAASSSAPAPAAVSAVPPAPKPAASAPTKPEAKPEPKPDPAPAAKPEPKPEPKVEAKPAPKPEPKPEPRAPAVASGSAAGSAASTAAVPVPVADADARFIVQIGAFADDARVREVRARVERAGLKTYIHTIDTPDGKRTRVRVGPYATRADAEKAAERLRSIDLPGAILTL